MARPRTPHGFALLEVLVALSVLGVVLLGSSLLMLAALRGAAATAHRALASTLALDLIERLRANRAAAALYAVEFDDDPSESPPCTTGLACDPGARAATDMAEWRDALQALPAGASARVVPTVDANGQWRSIEVELRWLEPGAGTQSLRLEGGDAP